MRCISYRLCAAMLFMVSATGAQDAPGPMAGVGGVFRDAEAKALAPQEDAAGAAAVKDNAAPAAMDAPAVEETAQGDTRLVGPIASVAIAGDEDFAADHRIAARILEKLNGPADGGEELVPKTVEDVKRAVAAVRSELIGQGFYLLRIWPDGTRFYDPGAKSIALVMDAGRFGKINVTFNGGEDDGLWFSSKQIRKRFRKIKEGEVFDYSRLRSALFDANASPDLVIDTDIDARTSLVDMPGSSKRAVRDADISLDVRESFPFHAVWEINNFGVEDVEEWQTSLTLQYMNLTKHDDVLTIAPSMSIGAELVSVAASYMLPHTWLRDGATTIYGGYSYLDVDGIVRYLDLDGTGYFAGLQHSENIINDDERNLAVSAGILWRYLKDQYHVSYLNSDGVRERYGLNERNASILPVSLALSYTEKRPDSFGGRNFATVQGVWNFASFGDSLDDIWQDADDNFWILRWQIARLQSIFGFMDESISKRLHQWMLYMKIEGQYTPYTLIPTEKLQLGGYNCLRGYSTRGYIGDWGVYGTFELRTPILVDAISSVFSDRSGAMPFDRLQFIGFLDYGWTNFNDLPSGYDDSEFLASAGLGARMAVTKHSQLRCDLAFPFVDGNNKDDNDYELYLSVQVQF